MKSTSAALAKTQAVSPELISAGTAVSLDVRNVRHTTKRAGSNNFETERMRNASVDAGWKQIFYKFFPMERDKMIVIDQ
jgi:hypothetical protein